MMKYTRQTNIKHALALLLCLLLAVPAIAHAHDGGLDAYGCHHDRSVGGYHCHRGSMIGQKFDSMSDMRQTLIPQSPQAQKPPKRLELPATNLGVQKK